MLGNKQRKTSETSEAEEQKYKSFSETFSVSCFAMAVTMMYPNPKNEIKRFTILAIMLTTFLPMAVCFCCELYDSFMLNDMDNITRQTTILNPFITIPAKIFLCNYKRREFEYLLNMISSDLIATNDLSDDYQVIVDKYILSGKCGQNTWLVASIIVPGMFPGMAMILMMHHNLTHNDTKRYMLHEIKIPGLGERRYESPYFEIIFVYMMYLMVYFQASFTGYDGTFCVCANHATMKFKLLTHKLTKIFDEKSDVKVMKRELKDVIVEHQNLFKFVEILQSFYSPWLVMVFNLALIQTCTTLYQLNESEHIDPKYLFFVFGSILHIFIPCYFSAALSQASIDSSTEIYCCGWERVMDNWTTDCVRFMIARAQITTELNAMGMVVFNMSLFISMCQTSYSMYTLLTSN